MDIPFSRFFVSFFFLLFWWCKGSGLLFFGSASRLLTPPPSVWWCQVALMGLVKRARIEPLAGGASRGVKRKETRGTPKFEAEWSFFLLTSRSTYNILIGSRVKA
eukprot:Lithocolla_globosa_v1_NODE_136_length_5835_cov_11.826644.p11 type:complete len:105 gc:universal NODE_136_length_5835_cov_11.826644:2187-2501(+)